MPLLGKLPNFLFWLYTFEALNGVILQGNSYSFPQEGPKKRKINPGNNTRFKNNEPIENEKIK